jgi:hypothetical protein
VLGEISSPKKVVQSAGKDAKFMFNTTNSNSILGVKFGLDGGKTYPVPKFITAVNRNGKPDVTCGSDLDMPVAARYKERVYFIGDLAKGHAWFEIKHVDINDTNMYMANIRETSSDKYREFAVTLSVIEAGKLIAILYDFFVFFPVIFSCHTTR